MPSASHPAAPDSRGQFGPYGGRYMPETLIPALDELERSFKALLADDAFWRDFREMLADYVGRPSPLFLARGISEELGGAQVYLKREDLNHTGAHKINNCLGQVLLARRMGKRRVVAETGAGQHGVATATVCALHGLECVVYMGAQDMERQSVNVRRMRMLGAEVRAVHTGAATLKDAMNEALRDWIANPADTYYLLGTCAGPHPYPWLVREFQKVIGEETRQQIAAKTGRMPDAMIACVGGGSNALGFFYPFVAQQDVRLYGVEAGGLGLASGAHAASIGAGEAGVLHGCRSYYLQDEDGQILDAHSISAGLDYPGVGPEHALLHDNGRVDYVSVTDAEAVSAFHWLTRREGILPALESAHALAYARKLAPTMGRGEILVVCLSGRGDKDLDTVTQFGEVAQ
ncbi:tryptophan synthase subunit beta [Achromobacter denitrificans]|jgi:tryptophan synthase beta chain|uniref:Tryptophan synthase beta chain n=1 Tax=Achromobacter denitrificans TaxID=32002 RepID=A0ABZ3FYG9_ACHDE|nr:tryptophan synthase subunit beta [Achromobacter denitrificans]MDX3878305.1 tryptophan synthase subunit beta [Achromobacter sp.]ASC65787.1 tryptophan synthase subunit beta [Achromobacter denitrificans]MBV2161606.1 tryptophan synthase subunit beta [Achromobacter denitrificans]MDF3856828.1 tryptophan synthase subunit beta [Achromobacter denitrificans]MPT40062.1 tryptophan synthase subunit beta [Achromobacter sp.]